MKMTPENFGPILAKAITDSFTINPGDPNVGMKTLISGLELFMTEILKDVGAGSKENQLPGFIQLRSAIGEVMNDHMEQARLRFEAYAREYPDGIFTKIIVEPKVFDVMTIFLPPVTITAFCRHCRQNQEFQLDDQMGTCPECGWEIRFVNR